MINILVLFLIIIVSLVIGLGIYGMFLFFKREQIPIDYSIIHNYSNRWEVCKYFEGIIVEEIKGRKRDGIVYIPRDINFVKLSQEQSKMMIIRSLKSINIPKQIIWFEKHQRKDYPRGTLSPERNLVKIYSYHPEDLPELLKESEEGKKLMEAIALKNVKKTQEEILRIEADRVKYIAKELGGSEPLSEDYLKFLKARQDDSLNILSKEKEVKPVGGFYNKPPQ